MTGSTAVVAAPCGKCPFRSDVPIYLRKDRRAGIVESILLNDEDFYCHQTTTYDEETEDMEVGRDSKICAGAIKMIEQSHGSTNMMRVLERIGMYDAAQIGRGAEVWDQDEFLGLPEGAVKVDGVVVDHETKAEVEPEEVETCNTVNEGCLAPAGYLGSGGGVVYGTEAADGECAGCGEGLCSNCADDEGMCSLCSTTDDD